MIGLDCSCDDLRPTGPILPSHPARSALGRDVEDELGPGALTRNGRAGQGARDRAQGGRLGKDPLAVDRVTQFRMIRGFYSLGPPPPSIPTPPIGMPRTH